MTYSDVLAVIRVALSQRPFGQKVLVSAHEAAEIKLLDFIQQTIVSIPTLIEGHCTTFATEPTKMNWSAPFHNTDYSFTINGFDSSGGPVEIIILEKAADYLNIKTFVAAEINAIGMTYYINH